MVSALKDAFPPPAEAGPAWEIARLFPDQGFWEEGDYLYLNQLTNNLVELTDGKVEVLEMPTRRHQRIVLFLRDAIQNLIAPDKRGEVLVAAYPLRVRARTFREPDVLYVRPENLHRMHDEFSEFADIVVEVVSTNRNRDFVLKRADYAQAGIPEYWIVDPEEKRVIVLKLVDGQYVQHGSWSTGDTATSTVLPDLQVNVTSLFE